MRNKQLWDQGQTGDMDVRTKMTCQRGDRYQLILIQAKKNWRQDFKAEENLHTHGPHPQSAWKTGWIL